MQLAILLKIFSDDLTNTQMGCHLGVTAASSRAKQEVKLMICFGGQLLLKWVRRLSESVGANQILNRFGAGSAADNN